MKIVYFADGLWGHNTFDLIIRNKDLEIIFVCVRYDNPDQELKKRCEKHDIDFFVEKNINEDFFYR